MDRSTWILLGVVGVMAVNQLVMRVGGLRSRTGVFWGMQLLNMVVGGSVMWFGLPGFEPWPVVSWVIGLLFFLRTAQNTTVRQRWLRSQRKAEVDENAQRLRDALAAAKARRAEADESEASAPDAPDQNHEQA